MQQSNTSSGRSWMRYVRLFLVILLIFICSVATAFAFLPVPEDPVIPLAEQGGGARQDNNATTGLQAVWPELQPVDTTMAELGWYLFFDPVLSTENDIACATCHHPDQGFGDGNQVAQGAHGEDLRRNVPSLWNVAYTEKAGTLFWDGRASTLEEQMLVPLTAANEMGADLEQLVTELKGIPEYVTRFNEVFGPSFPPEAALTSENILGAIAAYQRTLITQESPFDRFAAGDFNALTPAQRRGFDVFRSAETRCFECHAWPTFTHNTFHVLGVPDLDPEKPDLGRVETVNAADAERSFRTPGLRNVALTSPYMHNGIFATLEEVIKFYEDGSGVAFGIENVDEKARGFELTEQERADLVAFLFSLTGEPENLLGIPDSVPSGLPVVAHQENPARELVEVSTAPPWQPEAHEPQTITVKAGESIQAAVDRALPGDTVLVKPGIYNETVYVDMDGITIKGVVSGDSPEERPWLDGENWRSDGLNTTGDDFTLEGFGLRGYVGNDVLSTGSERVVYRDLIIEGITGVEGKSTIYGLYPIECTDVLIENTRVSGIADAGIYVGQSRGPIIVRNNEVFENVTGIEIENSTNAEVYDNYAHDNTGGILVFLLPNNPSKVGYNTRVYNNRILHNNHPNFGKPGSTVSLVPSGTGIFIMTADNTEVFDNQIEDNVTAGLILTSLYMIYPRDTVFDLGPLPENNWIHDNQWKNNGTDVQGEVKKLGIPGADILWTGEGWNNAFDEPNASKFPPIMPERNWADPAKRAIWRLYDIVIQMLL